MINLKEKLERAGKWLSPGMKIKRWILLSWVGFIIFSIGLILIVKINPLLELEYAISDFIKDHTDYNVRSVYVDIFFIFFGLLFMIVGVRQWFSSIFKEVAPDQGKNLVDVIYEKRHLRHRMKIVAIGGGTGLSSLLRGLKSYTSNITAVVTVADDGGSSGRLRKEMGVLPPGDIRNCLAALSDEENLMKTLFQYRFTDGEYLEGHSFGNLFLVAMTAIAGDFDKAIKQSSKILAIKGRVLPATLSTVTLCARMEDGSVIEGESSITNDERKIDSVFLKPEDCAPPDEVLSAIEEADMIILGPGSLYTSVLPNLLIKGIVEAINTSRAVTVYICNVMTQPGETDDFKASDHLKAIFRSASDLTIDYCIVNNEIPPKHILEKYEKQYQFPVEADIQEIKEIGLKPIAASLIYASDLVRHDPKKLSETIVRLITEISSQMI